MSIITGSGVGSFSSGNTTSAEEVVLQQQEELLNHFHGSNSLQEIAINGISAPQQQHPPPSKKKRNLPGTPDPSAEVIALSPKTLMATNRFVCEICKKGFQRDQNLQLHRRGHNLPWKLKQRSSTEIRKRVYVCPEPSCVHHDPSRALGDLTGIKKHFCRKHGEKKWKCDKCSKKYAVQSDWKAHSKTCGTREYKCDCGSVFSRRDSFITHRAFCDAIAEENKTILNQGQGVPVMSNNIVGQQNTQQRGDHIVSGSELIIPASVTMTNDEAATKPSTRSSTSDHFDIKIPNLTLVPQEVASNMSSTPTSGLNNNSLSSSTSSALFHNHHGQQVLLPSSISGYLSATELLQKAAQMGATMSSNNSSGMSMAPSTYGDEFTRYVNNQFMQHKNGGNIIPVQETSSSQFFGASNGNMGMFSGLLFDQNNNNGVLMKNMEHSVNGGNNNNTNNSFSLHGKNVSSGGDTMTLDFLGIGRGGNRPENFHDHQKRKVVHDEQQRQNKQEDGDDDQLGFGVWSWS